MAPPERRANAPRRSEGRCRVVAALLALLVALALPHPARADDDDGQPIPPPDTGIPGPLVDDATAPVLPGGSRACSSRLAICVHAARTASPRAVLGVLAAAERAWETLSGPLGLPVPDVDPGELAYPLYVLPNPGADGRTFVGARDVRSTIDRARAFTVLDESAVAPPSCARDALVAREIARAFLDRSAPATAEGIALAQTTYLAQLVVPCAAAFAVENATEFQMHPDRAPVDAEAGPRFTSGAALFWQRIDWAYGRGPGSMIMASWALAPTTTEIGSARWHDEPDAFDVLRNSFKGALSTGSTIDDLLLDTAVARAFMGSADDGLHAPETHALGDAARVMLDWDLSWPRQPKRLAPRAPVAPGGASYLVIHHAGIADSARLRVEIAWEEHALFRWALVKLDAAGLELGRVVIPTRERATEAQMTLVDLAGVDRVLLVGANAGDPAYRFDPDDEVWEPHGWLVTLAEE